MRFGVLSTRGRRVLGIGLACATALACGAGTATPPPAPAPAPTVAAPASPPRTGRAGRAPKGGQTAADTCCCALLPTDVAPTTYQILPKGDCAGNGPGGHWDGASCVDGDLCQE